MSGDAAQAAPDAAASKFLGRSAGRGGPFALLGLTHEAADQRAIREAVFRRLGQIDRHPMRATPEADELRLAIHAAAAQLADADLHAELVRHWPPGDPDAARAAWRTHLSAVSVQLATRAKLVVGASGGWNPRAKKRLAHLARLHRVSAVDLLAAIRPASGPGGPSAPRPARRLPVIPAPASTGGWWLRIHGALAAMLVLMLTLIAIELASPQDATPMASNASNAGGPSASPPARRSGGATPLVPGPRTEITHHAALEQELRNTLLLASDRPDEGAERGARAIDAFVANWTRMPPEARDRIATALAELLTRVAAASPESNAMLASITESAGSRDAVRAAGSAALARRLGSSPGVPRSVRARVVEAAGLDPQARAASTERMDPLLARALTDAIGLIDPADAEAWSDWSTSLASVPDAGSQLSTQARLDALERLLGAKPGADDGVLASDRWEDALAHVAAGLSWRAGDPARAWFLGVLTSDDHGTAAVSGLTEVLATRVSAPGVDPGMVLGSDADASQREALAGKYRAAWMNTAGVDPALRAEISERITRALAAPGPDQPAQDRSAKVNALLGLARANAAAAVLFAGDAALAAELLDEPALQPTGSGGAARDTGSGLSDEWARELLASEDAGRVLTMLNEASTRRAPATPLAAEAIVIKAMQGGQGGVRDRARDIVLGSAWDIQVLLALERAASRRASSALGEMITGVTGVALPPSRDEAWLDRVRAALLARVAERWAESRPGELEFAELTLAELAARRAGESAGARLLTSLAIEADAWNARNGLPEGDPLSASAIEARASARALSATAEIQAVSVRHRVLVEAVAAAGLAAGSRSRSSVERILGTLDRSWANAQTVIDQLLASHRAEAELWRSLLEGL